MPLLTTKTSPGRYWSTRYISKPVPRCLTQHLKWTLHVICDQRLYPLSPQISTIHHQTPQINSMQANSSSQTPPAPSFPPQNQPQKYAKMSSGGEPQRWMASTLSANICFSSSEWAEAHKRKCRRGVGQEDGWACPHASIKRLGSRVWSIISWYTGLHQVMCPRGYYYRRRVYISFTGVHPFVKGGLVLESFGNPHGVIQTSVFRKWSSDILQMQVMIAHWS